jgi:hypothetical protein
LSYYLNAKEVKATNSPANADLLKRQGVEKMFGKTKKLMNYATEKTGVDKVTKVVLAPHEKFVEHREVQHDKKEAKMRAKDKSGKYEGDILMEAEGQNGMLMLLPDRVRIVRRGKISLLTQGVKGHKEILISQISGIKFKGASKMVGYISFDYLGGTESKTGTAGQENDENGMTFYAKHQPAVIAMKAAIEQKMDEAHRPVGSAAPQVSVMDELQKLATMRDQGIVTEAEFQAHKNKLLGT